ncbi:reverse transcriptase domain-containing protein [Tanacetum coccineum]
MKHSYSNDDTCFSIDVIDEILEEDFDALLDEGSEILHSIKGTILKEKLFAEFDEFMSMTVVENSEFESDTEEPPFEKITFNTDYKIKTSLKEPPTDLELKPLPDNLEFVFLEEPSFLPVIISSQLSEENKNKLVSVLKKHKQAFAWKTTDIPGICPSFKTVGENRASWSDKLDEALWAFCTAFKIPIGCMPYKLVYEKSCHLPIELEHKAYWAMKHANFNLKTMGDHRKLQLNELNELRDQAYENYLIYKERTKKLHDLKIKNRIFNIGDRVLLFNSRLKLFSGKLKTRWSGPFTITKVFPYETIKLSQTDCPKFKVNGHRVKHYFGGDLPPKVV